MTNFQFKDQFAVEHIRESLWKTSGSRAAVMVGAGFSTNAAQNSASARKMPSWSQMSESLCRKLYSTASAESREDALKSAASTSGFLRLAQEFQAAYGRLALNEEIRALVPDDDYTPDEIHTLLMKLPWSDVLTTNWDTLLERTARDIHHIDYDIVRTHSEISSARRPRIVKLHGSLPAHEPFIFSEDDYRKYPRTHAPFVNLVQQTLMESVLCLIGFSGDDPNFLHWSGWVRDNLGDTAPKIYLVGWLQLSPHRRRLLEDRNVVPVDIASLEAAARWPDDIKHRLAAEWFLRAVGTQNRFDAQSWPKVSAMESVTPAILGEIPQPNEKLPAAEPHSPENSHNQPPDTVELRETVQSWAHNRSLYPGWFVAPLAVRTRIWDNTRNWINPILKAESEFAPHEYAPILEQLIWRLNVCLSPYFNDLMAVVENCLNQVQLSERQVCNLPVAHESRAVDWVKIGKSWIEAALMLCRAFRGEGEHAKCDLWLKKLEAILVHDDNLLCSISYERCLLIRDTGKLSELCDALQRWDIEKCDTGWAIRKAGLLFDVGQREAAVKCYQDAIAKTRRNRRRDQVDYAAFSREGWLLWYELIRSHEEDTSSHRARRTATYQRWAELGKYDCDPSSDFYELVRGLAESQAADEEPVRIEKQFHGGFTRHVKFGNGMKRRSKQSYEIFQLADYTGVPAFIDNHTLLGDGLRSAALTLAEDEQWAASAWTIRAAYSNSNEPLAYFSRARVASLPEAMMERLKKIVEAELNFFLEQGQPFGARYRLSNRIAALVEVRARLAIRASEHEVDSLLADVERYFKSNRFQTDAHLHSALKSLMKTAFQVAGHRRLVTSLLPLFSLPLIVGKFTWPEPSDIWPEELVVRINDINNRGSRWTALIEKLLSDVDRPDETTYIWSLLRLTVLIEIGLLTDNEKSKMAASIWSPDRLDINGYPTNFPLRDFALLALPENQPGQAQAAFRRRFLESTNMSQAGPRLWAIALAVSQRRSSTGGIALSDKDHDTIVKLILQRCSNVSGSPPPESSFGFSGEGTDDHAFLGSLQNLLPLNMSKDEAIIIWDTVELLANRFPAYALEVFPQLLTVLPDRAKRALELVRNGIVSDNSMEASGACRAVWRWLSLTSEDDALPKLPKSVLVEIADGLRRRRIPALIPSLELTRWLVKDGPAEERNVVLQEAEFALASLLTEATYDGPLAKRQDVDICELRAKCAHVAAVFARHLDATSEAALKWIAVATEDPMPEVRHAMSDEGTHKNPLCAL